MIRAISTRPPTSLNTSDQKLNQSTKRLKGKTNMAAAYHPFERIEHRV
jgi:hypothetical protein